MLENCDDNDDDQEINWGHLETNGVFDGVQELENRNKELEKQLVPKERKFDVKSLSEQTTSELNSHEMSIRNVIESKPSTPISLLVESLIQQLCSLLESDSKKSSVLYKRICEKLHKMNLIDNSYAMSEFETMRYQFQNALFQLVSVTKGDDLPIHLDNVWPLSLQNPQKGLEWSRYHREFEEMECIAEGGFGKVYRARHRLDGIEYAVKKIIIKSTSIQNVLSHLTEVKTIASLSHINIVPYKSCWLEPLLSNYQKDCKNGSRNGTSSTSSTTESSLVSSLKIDQDSLVLPKIKSAESSFTIDFEYSKSEMCEEDDQLDIVETANIVKRTATTYSSYASESQISVIEDNNAILPHVKLKWATLFIQMKLCQQTLRQWLDARNKCTSFNEFYKQYHADEDTPEDVHITKVNLSIFQQLINGLNYIHSRGIVHHDLKPSNIFITTEPDQNGYGLTIQLGDFGLACPLQQTDQDKHSNAMGTPLYSAPEQLNGKCDKKSDIYSLGVIFIELLVKCVTEMERFDMIAEISKGAVPTEMDPDFCGLIKKLLFHDPRKRPDVIQLQGFFNRLSYKITSNRELDDLKHELDVKDSEITTLRTEYESKSQHHINEISQKNMEIQMKDKQLEQKNNEILELKNEILKLKKSLSLE